ncbi:hypothetical protein COU79_01230 [Candidatus Peregrinibacteria bacterium CG10_big_fil_rev_8_21_14_0_10_54_7]|nr:MAG: hypothetical protein COU79_01230 [Candidatus Peregrinibacteria bacterium CG10_big_fil_rev_8_21_14_0_10_54_7]
MSGNNRQKKKDEQRNAQHSNAKMGKRARAKLAQRRAEELKAARKYAREHPNLSDHEYHRLMKSAKGG